MKLNSLLEINQLHRTYLGYKRIIQLCVGTFVLRLLILCIAGNIVNLELNEITKFRLDEINKIKDFFNNEINGRKQQINKISKYIAAFNYTDKVFIVLSASFGSLSIASHATVVGIPVRIPGASLTLVFTACMGVVKTLLSTTKKKKKKHNKIMMHESTSLSMIKLIDRF